MKKIVTVEGMSCKHCQMHVEKALSGVENVQKVKVSLQAGEAEITFAKPVNDQLLINAVNEAGYKALKVRQAE